MNLYEFYKNYNLMELDILHIYNEYNKLYILLGMPANLELIANGYRPEIDLYFKHMFIFNNYKGCNINKKGVLSASDYKYDNGIITFNIKGVNIILENNTVDVIMNYE